MIDKMRIRHIIIPVVILLFLIIISLVPTKSLVVYTPITDTCIGCHDGSIASYKRPHNGTIMCEQCHTTDVHRMKYVQPNGTLGDRSTSATCIDCHETGVPGFNSPIIPNTKHSSRINNGSIWGSYWSSERNNISCLYCHGDTKHDVVALGKIINITDDMTNKRNGSISETTWCVDCHYNNDYYKGDLWNPVPPLITIKNTNNNDWTNHTDYLNNGYGDIRCKSCHPINGAYSEYSNKYVHSIRGVSRDACLDCHWMAY